MGIFNRKQLMVRRIIRIYARNYQRMLTRYYRIEFVKKGRSVELIIAHIKNDSSGIAKAASQVKSVLDKQIKFVAEAEASMEDFANSKGPRLAAWLQEVGALQLVPYINYQSQMLGMLSKFLKDHKISSILEMEDNALEEKDYSKFEIIFKSELKLYKQFDNVVESVIDKMKGFFEYQEGKGIMFDEAKPAFKAAYAEISSIKKARIPAFARIFAAATLFFVFLATLVPGEVAHSRVMPLAKASNVRLHVSLDGESSLKKLKNECENMVSTLKAKKTMSKSDSNEMIIKYHNLIDEIDESVNAVENLKKANPERTIAQMKASIDQFEELAEKLEAKAMAYSEMSGFFLLE